MTVPATAEYIGGFAVTPDGALYVTIDPSSSPTFTALTLTGVLSISAGAGSDAQLLVKGGGTDDMVRLGTAAAGSGGEINAANAAQGAYALLRVIGTTIQMKPGNSTLCTFGTTGVNVAKHITTTAPVTETNATHTVADTENTIICNRAGTVTVTLPAAASYTGRAIRFVTIQAQQVDSASSNVVPRAGGAAGTAILGASDGAWADLVSDGTSWVITASS